MKLIKFLNFIFLNCIGIAQPMSFVVFGIIGGFMCALSTNINGSNDYGYFAHPIYDFVALAIWKFALVGLAYWTITQLVALVKWIFR